MCDSLGGSHGSSSNANVGPLGHQPMNQVTQLALLCVRAMAAWEVPALQAAAASCMACV